MRREGLGKAPPCSGERLCSQHHPRGVRVSPCGHPASSAARTHPVWLLDPTEEKLKLPVAFPSLRLAATQISAQGCAILSSPTPVPPQPNRRGSSRQVQPHGTQPWRGVRVSPSHGTLSARLAMTRDVEDTAHTLPFICAGSLCLPIKPNSAHSFQRGTERQ